MIHIYFTSQEGGWVDLGGGMVVFRNVRAHIEQDDWVNWSEDRASTLTVEIQWNAERFTYEIIDLQMQVEPGGEPITGALLRALPVQYILKMCINRAIHVRTDVPGSNLQSLHNKTFETGFFARLRGQGPTPETLDWVARIYMLARIKLDPPTQYVANLLDVPLRTASHWVKLAKDRGHLSGVASNG